MREYFFSHLNEAIEMLREEKKGAKKVEQGGGK